MMNGDKTPGTYIRHHLRLPLLLLQFEQSFHSTKKTPPFLKECLQVPNSIEFVEVGREN